MNLLLQSVATATRLSLPITQWTCALLTRGLVWLSLLAAPAAMADDNLYSSHYQAQNQGNLRSLQANPEPELFSGTRRDEDNLKMLENGYDLIGFSQFEAGVVDAEQAREHGRHIQADSVLVYMKKGAGPSAASRMEVIKEAVKKGQSLTEKDLASDNTQYRYYATYWAKLPPPIFGVHVIKLVIKTSGDAAAANAATPSHGVRIIAVIHGSAAEKAGFQRGDQLLSIQGEKVEDAAMLSSLVRKYRGKTVTMQLDRLEAPVQLEVAL